MGAGCARLADRAWPSVRSYKLAGITRDRTRGPSYPRSRSMSRAAVGPGPSELPIRHSSDSPQFPRGSPRPRSRPTKIHRSLMFSVLRLNAIMIARSIAPIRSCPIPISRITRRIASLICNCRTSMYHTCIRLILSRRRSSRSRASTRAFSHPPSMLFTR